MKRLISAIVVMLGSATLTLPAQTSELTTLRAIHALNNDEAEKAIPVSFPATVTYCRAYARTLFVQDGDVAIFVLISPDTKVMPGDRVMVRGHTRRSFRPVVVGENITVVGHAGLPAPIPSNYQELIHAEHDSMRVTVHGVVRAADMLSTENATSTYLQMLADDGTIDAIVENQDTSLLSKLLDVEVEVTGVAAGKFDNKMQQTGVQLHVVSMDDVKILKPATSNPWALPATPMDTIIRGYRVHDLTERIRVHGTITFYQPGSAVALQDGTQSLWIMTQTRDKLRVGDLANATGFPGVRDGFLVLTSGEIQDSHIYAPIEPLPSDWDKLALGGNTHIGHVYDLVSVEGVVVTETREAAQDEYVITSDGHLLTAIVRRSDAPGAPTEMKQVPLGSKVRVSGVCVLDDSNPFNGAVPFDILLRTFDDIEVIGKPSVMSTRNLILAVSLLLVVVIAVGAWGWTLRSKVHKQTGTLATMAQFEQRRSLILEKINGSDPLAEILEEISALVSSLLGEAPSWCRMAGGATLGKRPPELTGLRVVEMEIAGGHKGAPLGALSVALPASEPASEPETRALKVGARLAALAIETRRLYSDLRRRSEFDLLTDVPNRFAMEKFMDARIEEARQTAGLLGLIYIDLDKFKPINDQYGHHVGDLFLQDVAARMKRQLRGGDMLARLGGDEFAVLVSVVHTRAEVEDIVHRLEHCFDDAFVVEGYLLHGGASIGIALYPENGTTKDSLLNAADAAMYVVKNERKLREKETADNEAVKKI